MSISAFIDEVMSIHKTGKATEHSYRKPLQILFDSLADEVRTINEPQREKFGAPDLILTRRLHKGELAFGHCEAKDIGVGLKMRRGTTNYDQKERYKRALPNLIYTNCLDWEFWREGELLAEVKIGEPIMGIQPLPENYNTLLYLLKDFTAERPQNITSSQELAKMMAGKAGLVKDILAKVLIADEEQTSDLAGQYKAFRDNLIHDITLEGFADIYAETIAYGMFAARLHDPTPEDFSREEALELLPKSNPFMRSLFGYIAGPNLDENIRWVIDDLAQIFQASNVAKIMERYGKASNRTDPFIHFYEDFLKEYNPQKRKARGVWYTPEAVVKFILRAVDDVLKEEFSLHMGLADNSKVVVDVPTGQKDKKGNLLTEKREMHRVQILDPATGTGTFLAEAARQIAPKIKGVAPGKWSQYIEEDLIPRIHGFELLMASYAMCHMKMDMVFKSLDYKPSPKPPRLSVYLTNSLEESEEEVSDLFMARWLSDEAKGANDVKRDKPIMCVIGNPPYSGESANKGAWIMALMEAYKKEPGGKEKLKERNPKWINDDYVKFIRLSEYMIEKNGEGVLGFITNHGYLDNPTFRGMRWHLMKTFDKIYIIDLHGNAKKKEVSPDGTPDKNVFDIQQGVAIIIAVKTTPTPRKEKDIKLAQVFHKDLWGARQKKYDALNEAATSQVDWKPVAPRLPQLAFVDRDFALQEKYESGFGVQELMPVNSVGIVTARDALTIDMDKEVLWQRVQDFTVLEAEDLRQKYNLGKDVRDWRVQWAKDDVIKNFDKSHLVPIAYRPFDTRWTYYTGKSRGFQVYPRHEVMRHILDKQNFGFGVTRTIEGRRQFADCVVFDAPITHHTVSIKEVNSLYLLYLYPDETPEETIDAFDPATRTVNFDPKIHKAILKAATPKGGKKPDEVAIFDYIYGVLHCPAYREKYAEFLKVDFPRIPYPPSPEIFADVSAKGTQLRHLHLMDNAAIGEAPYTFDGPPPDEENDCVVGTPEYREVTKTRGSVYINETQFFADVPLIAWEFYIGGYQPARKWLKDRKGRGLSFDDIQHYQKIIKILSETDRIMKTIDFPLE
ncbi:MAG: N-6 DNA methylase [Aquisalinus sp.]|nr:N-6 DNA methylase [Aquisalinus sp.]